VLFTNVVGTGVPFQFTVEFDSNPLPVIVIVADCACGTLCGEIPLTCGVGLITEKFTPGELPPPGDGFVTTTGANSPALRAVAGTWACSVVELLYVVGTGLPLNDTTDPCINPLPATVTVCAAAPAVTLVGETDATLGTGFTVPPPPPEPDPPPEQPETRRQTRPIADRRNPACRK
jgi:hypothetical protein